MIVWCFYNKGFRLYAQPFYMTMGPGSRLTPTFIIEPKMSDDEILEYLRTCAEALGHSPYSYEVEGGRYIAGRFVCWSIALTEAELPLPKGCHKPRREQKLEFLARKNGCQLGSSPDAYK